MRYHPATVIPFGPIDAKPIENPGPLLRSALGERVKFTATVSHFSSHRNWQGLTQALIVLKHICFADNGAQIVQEQAFVHGIWSQDLYPGHTICFEGRFDTVEKRGIVKDMILRPSRVEIL